MSIQFNFKNALMPLVMHPLILKLVNLLTKRSPKIIMYHAFNESIDAQSVSASMFEWQLRRIKKSYTPLSLIELTELISQKKKIPSNSVVLTIDDGYHNFYQYAYPLLKKYKIPATFFVTTDFIDGKIWLATDKVKWILNETDVTSLFSFNNDRIPLKFDALNRHLEVLGKAGRNEFIKALEHHCQVNLPIEVPPEFKACTWKELAEMENNGIEIGSHTATHATLTTLTTEQELAYEIKESLHRINDILGSKDRTFCYPNGMPMDYNKDIKKMVKEAGYLNGVVAFTDKHNATIPFAWRRFSGSGSKSHFLKVLNGIELLENNIKCKKACNY